MIVPLLALPVESFAVKPLPFGRCQTPVNHVDHSVGSVRHGGNLPTINDSAGRRIVAFLLKGKRIDSVGIGREEDIVAVGIRDIAAVRGGRQVRICSGNQNRKIRLIGIGDLRMINRNGAAVEAAVGPVLRCCWNLTSRRKQAEEGKDFN